jgi:hypothetical protein
LAALLARLPHFTIAAQSGPADQPSRENEWAGSTKLRSPLSWHPRPLSAPYRILSSPSPELSLSERQLVIEMIPLTPIKTPLAPAYRNAVKELQHAILDAQAKVDETRQSTSSESPHIRRFIASIPFIEAALENGTQVSLKFLAGLRHPNTGLACYVALSRDRAAAFVDSEFVDWTWILAKNGNRAPHVFLDPPVKGTTAAAVLYGLAHPGTHVKRVRLRDRNSLNLCNENMEAIPSEQLRGHKSTVPDLNPDYERLGAILGSVANDN